MDNKFFKFIKMVFLGVKKIIDNQLNKNNYSNLSIIAWIVSALVGNYLPDTYLGYFFKGLLYFLFIGFFIYMIYINLVTNKGQLDVYYKNLSCISFFILPFIINGVIYFSKITFVRLGVYINLVLAIPFFISIYCFIRYILFRFINNWIKHVLFFIFTPILAAFLWGLMIDILVTFTKIKFLFSDKMSLVVIVLFSTLLVNLSLLWHKDRLIEFKVSVYFVLALTSTVSYFLFLINYFVPDLFILGLPLDDVIKIIKK